jgi:hypothetical protein
MFNGILEPYITLADDPTNPSKSADLPAITYTLNDTASGIRIDFTKSSNIDMSKVKAILMYQANGNSTATIIAKNVSKLADSQKLQSWYLYPTYNE